MTPQFTVHDATNNNRNQIVPANLYGVLIIDGACQHPSESSWGRQRKGVRPASGRWPPSEPPAPPSGSLQTWGRGMGSRWAVVNLRGQWDVQSIPGHPLSAFLFIVAILPAAWSKCLCSSPSTGGIAPTRGHCPRSWCSDLQLDHRTVPICARARRLRPWPQPRALGAWLQPSPGPGLLETSQ